MNENKDFIIKNNTLIKYNGENEHIVIPFGITAIEKEAFLNNDAKSITIPNSVTTIEDKAFFGCKFLNEIIIPDNVTYIGKYAFSNCRKLTKVNLSNCLSMIDFNTFENCISLESIVIPSNITKLEGYAFWGCNSLSKVIFEGEINHLGLYVFPYIDNPKEIVVTSVECKRLLEKTLNIPEKCRVAIDTYSNSKNKHKIIASKSFGINDIDNNIKNITIRLSELKKIFK